MQKAPFNEGGLEQNRQHSKSDRRAELSCFLALLDAAHSRCIPTLLKGEIMPLKLFLQTLSRRSLLRPKGSAHTRVRYDRAIETTRREAS